MVGSAVENGPSEIHRCCERFDVLRASSPATGLVGFHLRISVGLASPVPRRGKSYCPTWTGDLGRDRRSRGRAPLPCSAASSPFTSPDVGPPASPPRSASPPPARGCETPRSP